MCVFSFFFILFFYHSTKPPTQVNNSFYTLYVMNRDQIIEQYCWKLVWWIRSSTTESCYFFRKTPSWCSADSVASEWFFLAFRHTIQRLLCSLLKLSANKQKNSNFYSTFSRLPLETLFKSSRPALSLGVSGPRQIKAVSELSCQELMWFFRSNYGEVMVAFGDGWLFCQSPAISFLSVGDTAGRVERLGVIGQ